MTAPSIRVVWLLSLVVLGGCEAGTARAGSGGEGRSHDASDLGAQPVDVSDAEQDSGDSLGDSGELDVLEESDAPADADAVLEDDVEDIADLEVSIDCGELTPCGTTCVDTLTEPTSCGFCGRTCVVLNGEADCESGECTIGLCWPGYFDTDGVVDNGCEAEDTCTPDAPCATDCGSEGMTVCESATATCPPPEEVCNAVDDDCDGACDEEGLVNCRRGIHRGYGNGHVYSDDLDFVSADPYHVETENYFHLYQAAGPSMRPVFLCRKANGLRLLTSDIGCEDGGGPERTIGYWSPVEQCGSVPLYRLHQPEEDNHLYTLHTRERDYARDTLGYLDEGVAGYVWSDP